jgi:hypothetical protein
LNQIFLACKRESQESGLESIGGFGLDTPKLSKDKSGSNRFEKTIGSKQFKGKIKVKYCGEELANHSNIGAWLKAVQDRYSKPS